MKKKTFTRYIFNRYDLRKISALSAITLVFFAVARVCDAPVLANGIAVAYLIVCGLFFYISYLAFKRYSK